jgi:organic radical activating enzyme|tara:strand:+ start:8802 stop:10268 length:1467 start_codon:yes stop_codon:yes gene_type:complete
MTKTYLEAAAEAKKKLNAISPTMCMAKWLQVSMHLPLGKTQSCYHPPTHIVPLNELKTNKTALHNTKEKAEQRRMMLAGKRPSGCQYCWNIEDAPKGPHLSDRHYRSSEDWVGTDGWNDVLAAGADGNINPRYVEVNFNQACNFKCSYCGPVYSTEWEKEAAEHGPLPLSGKHETWNNLALLKQQGAMPLPGASKENPYVEAFWDWWPELYKTLKVFRMTGGEPLMDKNTFKVLEYVNANPKSDLELSITSNMNPPSAKLFDRFMTLVKEIEVSRTWQDGVTEHTGSACKHFNLYVSVDAVGDHAEYLRTGLNYDTLLSNTHRFLTESKNSHVNFINTFNIMSIPRLLDFLKLVMELRKTYSTETKNHRVWFDIPYLRLPNWMSIQNIREFPEIVKYLTNCVDFMEQNDNWFKDYEVAKLKRNIAWIEQGANDITPQELITRKRDFYVYFSALDNRRNTDFSSIFTELSSWWDSCQQEQIKHEKVDIK